MTKLLSTFAVALATIFLSTANAADLGRGPVGDPTSVASEQPFSWTGFYVGGRIGYGNANHEIGVEQYFKDYCGDEGDTDKFADGDRDDRIDDLVDGVLVCEASGNDSVLVAGDSREVASLNGLNSSGVTGGFQLGFDKQLGQRIVVGVFGSYDLSSMDTTASVGGVEFDLIEKGDEWSVGARLGYLLHPRVMAYVLAAYTEADWEFIGDIDGKKEVTFSGVTVGGGLEYAMTQNVFLGIEGTHTFYGQETLHDEYDADDNLGGRITDEIGETKVLGTVKIKMGVDSGLGF